MLYDVNVDVGFLSESHFDQLANLTNIDQIILWFYCGHYAVHQVEVSRVGYGDVIIVDFIVVVHFDYITY